MPEMPKYLDIKNFHNPSGMSAQNNLVISALSKRYDGFISKDIKYTVYKDGNSYVFKFKVPSEKNFKLKSDVFYDVIIEFFSNDESVIAGSSLKEYHMHVYSNVPTFTFNFTFVYNKIGALYKKIPQSLYSEKALSEPTKVTNPYKLVGIEKSIFYSLRKIYQDTGFNKGKVDKLLTDLVKNNPNFKFPGNIFSDVTSQISKLNELIDTEKLRLKTSKKQNTGNKSESSTKNKTTVGIEGKKNNLESVMTNNLSNSKLTKESDLSNKNKLKSTSLSKK